MESTIRAVHLDDGNIANLFSRQQRPDDALGLGAAGLALDDLGWREDVVDRHVVLTEQPLRQLVKYLQWQQQIMYTETI